MPSRRLALVVLALPLLASSDLEFDPARMPNGPVLRGFGYWDEGIVPRGDAVVAYTANETASPVATLVLNGPGRRGNAMYLGLHPYF